MRETLAAAGAELRKVRRSPLPWISVAVFVVAGFVSTTFIYSAQNPDRARNIGFLDDKGDVSGVVPDWTGLFDMFGQVTATGGFLVFGIIMIWLFGRAFSDHTVKDLLALPTRRDAIVIAKLLIGAAWCLALTVQLCLLGLLAGTALDLPGWSTRTALDGIGRIALTAVLTITVTTAFALAASIGRGYLSAVGTLFSALFLAQIVAQLGYGRFFPWSIHGLLNTEVRASIGPVGYGLVAAVGVVCATANVAWWRRADHHQ
jgi:ABC-2 type transport system permease protein